MLALALAYKREAEGAAINSYVFRSFVEGIILSQSTLSPTDLIEISNVLYNSVGGEDVVLLDPLMSETITLTLS